MGNKIGKIPEFTSDETPGEVAEEEVAASSAAESTEETVEEQETETPAEPSPAEQPSEQVAGEDAENEGEPDDKTADDPGTLKATVDSLKREIDGLSNARKDYIDDLTAARGLIRTIENLKKAETTEEKKDILDGVHPDDVKVIESVMKAKGYVSQADVQKMLYESRKQDEITNFLKEYREYNEGNDPDRKKFGPLLQELALYKEPTDPTGWGALLRRAHRAVSGQGSGARSTAVKKQLVKTAGVGAGGAQRSPSVKPMDERRKNLLLDAGFSMEEIKNIASQS